MAQFLGQLNHNEHFNSLFNAIINVQTFADNFVKKGSPLVSMAREEGSQYGDTKVFIAVDILRSYDWLDENNVADNNLLARDYSQEPDTQEIVINQFRQIALTLNPYMTKRAFASEGSYAAFTAVLTQMITETKRIYEEKMVHTFIGTNRADGTLQNITLTATPSDLEGEAAARYEAQNIARTIADLYVKLANASRDFNDLGNYRSYDKEDLVVVWNAEHVNKITKMDLPTMFNSTGLIDGFKYQLPADFFGTLKTSDGTVPGSSANTTIRSFVEKDYNTVAPKDPAYVKSLHIMPGDLIPAGKEYKAYEAYEEDPKVVCKIYHRKSIPLMSSFNVASSFYNAKSLETNRYLTWGFNTLENLDNYPFITISAAQA